MYNACVWKTRCLYLCIAFSAVIVLIAGFCCYYFFVFNKMILYTKKNFSLQFSYLRSQKSYTPPTDVSEKINSILSSSNITDTTRQLELSEKFNILKAFNDTFDHCVPNSHLHEISTIGKM